MANAGARYPGVALADFDAEADGYGPEYLRFHRGDSMFILSHPENDSDWVFCEMRGRTGWVPRNFIGEESACASARPAQSSRSETVPSTAADSKRQEDECDRCAKLEKQIQDLKLAIAEIKKTSQSPFNGKAIGTYTVLRKESRYYVVEATFPGTTEKQYFKWYFDPVEASESLSG